MSTPGNRVATREASQAMPVPAATRVFMSAEWLRKAETAPLKNSLPHQNSTGVLSTSWLQGLVNQPGSQLRWTPSMWGRLASITRRVSTTATASLRRSRVSSRASSRSIAVTLSSAGSGWQQEGLVRGERIGTRSIAMACLLKLWDPVHGRVKPSALPTSPGQVQP